MPSLTPPDWQEVRTLFEAAADRPLAEREGLLTKACAGRQDLRREVESLLEALDEVERTDAISSPFVAGAPAREGATHEPARLGEVVGAYRLLEVVGRGGMGVVYRAEHVDTRLARRAAVKLLRRDFRPDDLRRFRQEQHILARLEHPHIARLLDAGVTEDGTPFLIMEYVDGTPLLEHCEGARLSLTQRLELFEQVCRAVQVAHSHLIVHRDLKPSNILVDRDGRPRLLDFGIAKRLGDEAGDGEALTRTGQQVLTPEYASPEQFRGEPAGTLSDVYSLGVVLYELLCGRRPYRLDGLSAAEAERLVCEQPPARPSSTGGPESRRLAGDLDVIVLTALGKEPARRYASAAQLADDLRRHREGQPILARPDTITYRLGKFAMRNRVLLTALSLVVVALLAGIVMTARQAAETRRRFEQVRSLANTMLFDIQSEIRDRPGLTRLRQRLVGTAAAHLEGLARDAARDPALLTELAAAEEQLGELRGDPHYASLGDLAGAIESYQMAERIRRELLQATPDDPARQHALARVSARLAAAQSWNGDNDGAIARGGEALATLEHLAGRNPTDVALLMDETRVRAEHGWFRIWAGELEAGTAHVRRAAAVLDSLLALSPDDLERVLARADCSIYLADGLKFAGRYADVVRELEPRLATLERLGAGRPDHVRLRRKWLASLKQMGEALEWVDPPRALRVHRQAVEVARAQARVDGDNAATRRSLASSHSHLGGALLDSGRPAEAIEALTEASREQRWLFERDSSNHSDGGQLSTSLMWLAQAHTRLGQHGRAIEQARAAVRVREAMLVRLRGDAANLGNLAGAHGALGAAQAGLAADRRTPVSASRESWRESQAAYGRALELFEGLEREGRLMEFWAPSLSACRRGKRLADSALAASPSAR